MNKNQLAVATTYMVDPGTAYGTSVEQALKLIAAAQQWPAERQEVQHGTAAWRVLCAYSGTGHVVLDKLSPAFRYELLLTTEPQLAFRTPAPEWARRTQGNGFEDGSAECIHELPFMDREGIYVGIQVRDVLLDGEVTKGEPEVLVTSEPYGSALSPGALMDLSRACIAAAIRIARIRTGAL